MSTKKYLTAIALSAITASLSASAKAADKLNIPVEVTPCTVVTLPDGSKACEPPKVSQAGCIRVEVRQGGKFVKYIWVCTPPRESKPEPKPTNDKPKRGY